MFPLLSSGLIPGGLMCQNIQGKTSFVPISMFPCLFSQNSGPGNRKREKVSETDRSKAFISATKNIQPSSLKQSQNRLAKKSILSKVKLKC